MNGLSVLTLDLKPLHQVKPFFKTITMQYKGNNFKKILGAIVSSKHSQIISIESYMHMVDGSVSINYVYREQGKTKAHTTSVSVAQLLEFQMNYLLN